ncbi:hypothetical protein LCGC14_1737460 [marine sediment metagenome]|uniref:Uncharacterized protein n=1 Tax=marine sediment metagenome TaxID=412755 RepID=A0A0F9H7Q5_9ZZZZ
MAARRIIIPARFPGGGIPEIVSYQYTGSNIVKGSVVEFSSGQVTIMSSTPSSGIVGIALEDQASKPGFEPSHDSLTTVYTGRVSEVSVAIANLQTVFSAGFVSGTVPAISHIGGTRPLVLDTGIWRVSLSASGTDAVTVVDVDVDEQIVFFKFLESAIANT